MPLSRTAKHEARTFQSRNLFNPILRGNENFLNRKHRFGFDRRWLVGGQDFMNTINDTLTHGRTSHHIPFFEITAIHEIRIPEFLLVVFVGMILSQIVTVRSDIVDDFDG